MASNQADKAGQGVQCHHKIKYYADIAKGFLFALLSTIFAVIAFLFINYEKLNIYQNIFLSIALILLFMTLISKIIYIKYISKDLERL